MADVKLTAFIEVSDIDNIRVLEEKGLIGQKLKSKIQLFFEDRLYFACVKLDDNFVFSCHFAEKMVEEDVHRRQITKLLDN